MSIPLIGGVASGLPIIGRPSPSASARGEGVPEVMHPDVFRPGLCSDGLPDAVVPAVAEATVPVFARKHPRVVLSTRQRFQKPCRRRRQLDRAGIGLGIGEMKLAGGEIDVRPARGQNLALVATGQHQEADLRSRIALAVPSMIGISGHMT